MARALASVRKIEKLQTIKDADMIELAKVDGWNLVVKKGEFQPGDFCVFFEIDSFLPEQLRYEFLRKSCFKDYGNKKGFRIRTIRLKGCLSQGLALPIAEFPEISEAKLNTDVTELLGIKNYQDIVEKITNSSLSGDARGNFPSFIRKTDQERIQNVSEYLSEYKDILFEVSHKLDGQSMSVYYNKGTFGVCSRNIDLKSPDTFGIFLVIKNWFCKKLGFQIKKKKVSVLWEVAKTLKLEDFLATLDKSLALQGELIGPTIQGNYEQQKDYSFYLFDVWDIKNQRYYTSDERLKFFDSLNWYLSKQESIQIQHVPVLEYKKLGDFKSISEILKYAEGTSLLETVEREGVVFKSCERINDRIVSFKAISNKYLLNKEK